MSLCPPKPQQALRDPSEQTHTSSRHTHRLSNEVEDASAEENVAQVTRPALPP